MSEVAAAAAAAAETAADVAGGGVPVVSVLANRFTFRLSAAMAVLPLLRFFLAALFPSLRVVRLAPGRDLGSGWGEGGAPLFVSFGSLLGGFKLLDFRKNSKHQQRNSSREKGGKGKGI